MTKLTTKADTQTRSPETGASSNSACQLNTYTTALLDLLHAHLDGLFVQSFRSSNRRWYSAAIFLARSELRGVGNDDGMEYMPDGR
jgi:hypothetical protein